MVNLKRFVVRDKEAGNIFISYGELKKAQSCIKMFEFVDKKEGIYTPDFYEVYDNELKEIVS